MNYDIREKHISTISVGDVVEHNGKLMTVGDGDMKRSEFMGVSIFGDSYRMGNKPARLVIMKRAKLPK